MTPIPDPDLTAAGGSTDHAGYVPWAEWRRPEGPYSRTPLPGSEAFIRERVCRWTEPHPGDHDVRAEPLTATKLAGTFDVPTELLDIGDPVRSAFDPAEPITPLAADPFDQGRCLVGCGHADDDPRCTGVWRMSDFGEVPF